VCTRGLVWVEVCSSDFELVQVHIFSRNCTDYADYAEIMRRYVLQLVDAEDCILDGEMMAWNEDEKRYNSFGHNRVGGVRVLMPVRSHPTQSCYVRGCADNHA